MPPRTRKPRSHSEEASAQAARIDSELLGGGKVPEPDPDAKRATKRLYRPDTGQLAYAVGDVLGDDAKQCVTGDVLGLHE